MSSDKLTYHGKNIGEARERARKDNKELKALGSDSRILVNTMKWDRSARTKNKERYYKVEYIGILF